MTKGEELKSLFGLDKYKYVVFERLLGFPLNTIVIYYNSFRPNVPITVDLLKRYYFFSARKAPSYKDFAKTPILPLEKFNSDSISIVLTVDIGGVITDPKNQMPREVVESVEDSELPKVQEWVTLRALQNPAATSAFTQNFRKIRNKAVGRENITAKPWRCAYNRKRDIMRFYFRTTATTPVYPKNYAFKRTQPSKDFALTRNASKRYTMQIQILGFMKWLKGTRPDSMANEPITRKEIKDVLDVAYVQVWCSCAALHWQSMNYNLSLVDGSIHPTDIAPTFWNQSRLQGDGNAFLCKHLSGLLNQIDFFLNPMAGMATKKLRELGII